MSERRKRLHDLLLTLINKDNEFEFIEEDSSDLTSSYSEKDTLNLSRVIEKNRKIIKRYQAIVRTTMFKLDISEGSDSLRFNFLIFSLTKPIFSQSQKSYKSIRFYSDKLFLIISKLELFESVIIAKLEGLALRASINLVVSLP